MNLWKPFALLLVAILVFPSSASAAGLDFTFDFFGTNKDSYNTGETVNLWATLKNTGTVEIDAAIADFSIVSPSGQTVFIDKNSNSYIKPNSLASISTAWTIPNNVEPGQYTAKVTVTSRETPTGPYVTKDRSYNFKVNAPSGNQGYTISLSSGTSDGTYSNVGQIYFTSPIYNTYNLPTSVILQNGQYEIMGCDPQASATGGKHYSFDHWETSGSVSVANSLKAGTTLTVSGSGSLKCVTSKFDFSLSVSPAQQTVNAGNTAYFTISISGYSGFTSNNGYSTYVDLAPSELPPSSSRHMDSPKYIGQSQQSTTATFYVVTSKDTPAGTYPITITGTTYGGNYPIVHSQTVNLIVNAPQETKPDLIVTDISWSPSNPTEGQQATFSYTIKNQGAGAATSHRNVLEINGVLTSNDEVTSSITAGSSLTRTFPHTWTATSGVHEVKVRADASNGLNEFSEDNNYLTRQIIVGSKQNQQPTAYIDSISPNPATKGQYIYFSGSGYDPDGSISWYNWRSNIDGQLSTSRSFSTSSLTQGTHTIYFKVKDNSGTWSSETTRTLTVSSSKTASASIHSVSVDKSSYNPGETVKVAVSIKNTGDVDLSGLKINVDIADPNGNNVKATTLKSGIGLSAGQTYSTGYISYYTIPSNPISGTYKITVGLWNSDSSKNYDLEYQITSFSVSATLNQLPKATITQVRPYITHMTSDFRPSVFVLVLKNTGIETAMDTTARINATPDGITIERESVKYGNIAPTYTSMGESSFKILVKNNNAKYLELKVEIKWRDSSGWQSKEMPILIPNPGSDYSDEWNDLMLDAIFDLTLPKESGLPFPFGWLIEQTSGGIYDRAIIVAVEDRDGVPVDGAVVSLSSDYEIGPTTRSGVIIWTNVECPGGEHCIPRDLWVRVLNPLTKKFETKGYLHIDSIPRISTDGIQIYRIQIEVSDEVTITSTSLPVSSPILTPTQTQPPTTKPTSLPTWTPEPTTVTTPSRYQKPEIIDLKVLTPSSIKKDGSDKIQVFYKLTEGFNPFKSENSLFMAGIFKMTIKNKVVIKEKWGLFDLLTRDVGKPVEFARTIERSGDDVIVKNEDGTSKTVTFNELDNYLRYYDYQISVKGSDFKSGFWPFEFWGGMHKNVYAEVNTEWSITSTINFGLSKSGSLSAKSEYAPIDVTAQGEDNAQKISGTSIETPTKTPTQSITSLTLTPSLKRLAIVEDAFNGDVTATAWAGLERTGPEQGFENGNYYIVDWQGDKYVALNGNTNKLAKLILEQRKVLRNDGTSHVEKKTLTVGETWDIGGGWTLTTPSIDAKASPRQAWLSLSYNGVKKDDKVIAQGMIYTYVEKSIAGESDVPLFVTYMDDVFVGATSDMAQFSYTWAISPEVEIINN